VEELLFALLVGLWKLIVRAYKRVRGWWQGRKEEADAEPMQRPSAERAPMSAEDLDPYTRQRQAVRDQLQALENEASSQSSTLGRSASNRPLGQALDRMVVHQSLELRQELDRLPTDSEGAVALARITAQASTLQRTSETLVWIAQQREHPTYGAPLAMADRIVEACYGPLLQFAAHRFAVPNRAPISFVATRDRMDLSDFSAAGLTAVALPNAFPDRLTGWSMVAHEVGRDFLESVQGFKWELRNRFGLPDRYPVPFASRGYLSEEEVLLPFGPWLEVLFGDLMGSLLLGPAYAESLAELLANPRNPSAVVVVGVTRDGASYTAEPPAHLRMAVAVAAMDDLGEGEQQQRIWQSWSERHGWPRVLYLPTRVEGWIEAPVQSFTDMAESVADLMLLEPMSALGDQSLDGVPGLAYSEVQQGAMDQVKSVALAGGDGSASDPRALLAGVLAAEQEAPHRSRQLLAWLQRTLAPQASPYKRRRPEAVATAAGGRTSEQDDLLSALRDAIVLDAILTRPRPGSRFPSAPR
jgi:hypothetical protein